MVTLLIANEFKPDVRQLCRRARESTGRDDVLLH